MVSSRNRDSIFKKRKSTHKNGSESDAGECPSKESSDHYSAPEFRIWRKHTFEQRVYSVHYM